MNRLYDKCRAMVNVYKITLFMTIVVLCVLWGFKTSVYATDIDFNLTYNQSQQTFTVRGVASPHSRVLLLVYSPSYDGEDIEGLYYFEAIDDVAPDGNYTFNIKMQPTKCENGTYTFQVGVSGDLSGSVEKSFEWLESEKSADFSLSYNEDNYEFIVSGDAVVASRVMLIVYSPSYNVQDMSGIYYFESVYSIDGKYTFNIKMNRRTCENGTYTFQIGVNGDVSGGVKKQYEWLGSETSSAGFSLTYNEADSQFTITGDAESASRVILIVYAPNYNAQDMSGIYYFDSLYSTDGKFNFDVRMKQGAGIGTYVFQVSVNGSNIGVRQHEYIWPEYNSIYDIKKFVLDGDFKTGSTISATAILGEDNSQSLPKIFIALYEKGLVTDKLKSINTLSSLTQVDLETRLSASIENLPNNIDNYYIKAYLFVGNDNIQPITRWVALGIK